MAESHTIEVIARGLIQRDDTVLLCKNLKHGHCYLPGGHVEFSEAASIALAREFEEEAGIHPSIGQCLLVHEHIFRQGGRLRHELNLVFHVELPHHVRVESLERKIRFDWVALRDLDDLVLYPESLKAWLRNVPRGTGVEWQSEPLE